MATPEGRTEEQLVVPVVDFATEDENDLVTVGASSAKRTAMRITERETMPPRGATPKKPTVSWVEVVSPTKQATAPTVNKPMLQPQQPAVNLKKIKMGVTLRHKSFGSGVVKAFQGSYIIIDFGRAEKKFLFPAAMVEGYLSLE